MTVATRLAAFAAVLALASVGAALAGAAIDPTDKQGAVTDEKHGGTQGAAAQDPHGSSMPPMATRGKAGHGAEMSAAASGLAVSDGGYSFDVDRAFFTAGEGAPFTFRITDDRGRVVRDEFELEHTKRLHLIVVRRDTAIFEHVHPRKGADGTWSVALNLREAGVYRAYADFKIDGKRRTLATDLFVPGDFRPNPLPAPASVARAVDDAGTPAGDLDVTLKATGVRAGRETPVTFAVLRNGQPLEALDAYLGAKGHLVALREGDLAYLHVHPTEGGSSRGNEVGFMATFPTAGRYRLFLQFQTGGKVRTVAYTVEVAL